MYIYIYIHIYNHTISINIIIIIIIVINIIPGDLREGEAAGAPGADRHAVGHDSVRQGSYL